MCQNYSLLWREIYDYHLNFSWEFEFEICGCHTISTTRKLFLFLWKEWNFTLEKCSPSIKELGVAASFCTIFFIISTFLTCFNTSTARVSFIVTVCLLFYELLIRFLNLCLTFMNIFMTFSSMNLLHIGSCYFNTIFSTHISALLTFKTSLFVLFTMVAAKIRYWSNWLPHFILILEIQICCRIYLSLRLYNWYFFIEKAGA